MVALRGEGFAEVVQEHVLLGVRRDWWCGQVAGSVWDLEL